MQCKRQNVFEMLRRGGAVVKSIHRAVFAAVGATWEPVKDVVHRNKGLTRTGGRRRSSWGRMCAALDPAHAQRAEADPGDTPLHVCSRHAAGLRRRARRRGAERQLRDLQRATPQAGHALHTHGIRSRPLTSCSRTRSSLTGATARCAASRRGWLYLAMAELLLVSFALPVTACGAPRVASR